MGCCTPYIEAGNSAFTDVPYTDAMKSLYGPLPRIDILYLNEDGNYVIAGIFTMKQFDGDRIFVDHGGPARWLLKVN